jgi:hypothetical protein
LSSISGTGPVELTFGFLEGCFRPIRFDFGVLEPLYERAQVEEMATLSFNSDGFIYPPMMRSYRGWPDEPVGSGDMVPGSERPASAFRTIATHKLTWSGPPLDKARYLPSIAIQLLGNWHGATLQFADWWSFRRLRWKVSKPFVGPETEHDEGFVTAMRNAESLSVDNTKRLVSLLSLLNSIITIRPYWEAFAWAYTCVDAAWRILTDQKAVATQGTVSHADRIRVLCTNLGIAFDEQTIKRAVRLRNDLLHEARWDGAPPGEQTSHEAFQSTYELHRLATRLVLFILGVDCEFRTTPWDHARNFGRVHRFALRRPT